MWVRGGRGPAVREQGGSGGSGGSGGRAVPGVMRDICDLSAQPESLQLFLYSGDLG